jgi:hypothetical protein
MRASGLQAVSAVVVAHARRPDATDAALAFDHVTKGVEHR